MKARTKLIAVAAGSMMIGVGGRMVLHAQTAVPPAYLIAELQMSDPDSFKQYLAALPGTLAPYEAKTVARGVAVAVDASDLPAGSVAVLAFNRMDNLKAWWNSPAYQAIIPLREKSAKTRAYALPGVPPS